MDQQLQQDVNALQSLFGAIWNAQTLKLTKDEVELIGSVYKRLNANKRNLNLACAECVRNALAFIAVWHNENQQKFPATQKQKISRLKK